MKLIRFQSNFGPRAGVVVGESIVDLVEANSDYTDISAIVSGGQDALDYVADLVSKSRPHHELSDVKLLAPISRPGKFMAIGMNYEKHKEEAQKLGVAPQTKQLWFNKQTSCISGPFDEIDPGVSEKLDYEVELGVVIGKPAKSVKKADAKDHIFGYFVLNDVSARDWQFHTQTFTMGKSFDSHGPMGPWIITADEIDNPHDLDLRCYVNGELRQSNNTSQMIHNVFEQIEYLSTAFTLESGDLIATGTPEGVGIAMEPPVFLQSGDTVTCVIDGIGSIVNKVRG